MKRKWISLGFAALFVLLLLVPSLGMLAFGPSRAAANEALSGSPRLKDKDGSLNLNVLSEAADYLGDHFAFRQELVTAWSRLNAGLLHTSVEEQVVLGQGGWLYYAPTLDDYRGLGLSDGLLACAAKNLALMQEYAEKQGCAFVFCVAPNKNSLYPEHMPAWVPADHSASNAARLPALLADYGVRYADLFAAFAGRETLYFQTDSHWTSRGAALAADTILAAIGRDSAFFASDFTGAQAHLGDLYEMLYPAGRQSEPDAAYAPGFHYTTASDPNGGNAIRIETSARGGAGSLVCWRDSFGIALYPYLAEAFDSALFSRAASYDLTLLSSRGADTAVIELVERNLAQLVDNPATYPAPERSCPEASPTGLALLLEVSDKLGAERDLLRFRGELPAEAQAGDAVYLLTERGCFEACLLRGSGEGLLGFAACLPAEAGSVLSVLYQSGGECVSFALA